MAEAKLIGKKEALESFLKYEEKKLSNLLSDKITDERPGGFIGYGLSENDSYWYLFPTADNCFIGRIRVVVISKTTAKVVYDGFSGE